MATTEEGKAISSRNATRHGCCSESTLILATENLADYKALAATWFKAYNPQDAAEKRLVQQLVNADWFSERTNRVLTDFESQLFAVNPMEWTEEQHKKLALFTRYQTARANAVIKARKAVEDHRKNRRLEQKQKAAPTRKPPTSSNKSEKPTPKAPTSSPAT